MKEEIVVGPDNVVAESINTIFTYINYFLVAALIVLLTYMTIRDFKKRLKAKKLTKQQAEYNRIGDKEKK